jgi:fermentation-respiration switch protein FrsA (DUF1100 family)
VYDAVKVVEFVLEKYYDDNKLPVYVWGHSLGGPQALHMALSSSLVSGVVLESTFTSLEDATADYPLLFPLWVVPRQVRVDSVSKLYSTVYGKDELSLFNTVQLIESAGGQKVKDLLILHGDSDLQLPQAFAEELYASATSVGLRVKKHIVKGGGHSDLHVRWHDELVEVFEEWTKGEK